MLSAVVVDVVQGVETLRHVALEHLHQLVAHAADLGAEGADQVVAAGQKPDVRDHAVQRHVRVAVGHLGRFGDPDVREHLVVGVSEGSRLLFRQFKDHFQFQTSTSDAFSIRIFHFYMKLTEKSVVGGEKDENNSLVTVKYVGSDDESKDHLHDDMNILKNPKTIAFSL